MVSLQGRSTPGTDKLLALVPKREQDCLLPHWSRSLCVLATVEQADHLRP